MRSGKYAAAQGDVLGRVATMDSAAVELKLLDLAKLVRTAQECQHQSDVLHGLKEDQLAVGIEALQRQLQQLQRAVWAAPHDGIGAGAIGAGGSTAALRASSAASSDLLLARRAELQALEARLQALEAAAARDAAAAKEAAAAREQVERMLLTRVIALEGSVAGGRAVRSAWAEQQDIRRLRQDLANLTSGVAGALSCLGLQPCLGAAAGQAEEEGETATSGGGGGAAAPDAEAGLRGQGLDEPRAVAAARRQLAAGLGQGSVGVGGSSTGQEEGAEIDAGSAACMPGIPTAAARVAPAAPAAGEDAGVKARRASALQDLPPVLQEAMDRTAQTAAAAAVQAYEARVAAQWEADAARVRALVGVVQSLGGAQRALAGQVEQLAELCPRLLEALQQARQLVAAPASASATTGAPAAGGLGGGRDAQLEEAYMLAAEAGGLMAGLKKALAEAMVLGADGAASWSEQLDAAVAGDVTLQPMLGEAKLLRARLAAGAATGVAPSDATDTAAATVAAAPKGPQPPPRPGALGVLQDATNTLHGHRAANIESAEGATFVISGTNECTGKPPLASTMRQSPTSLQSPEALAAAYVVPSAPPGSGGGHPGPYHQSLQGTAASASSAVSVVSLADLARPPSAAGTAQPHTLLTFVPQQQQQQQQHAGCHSYLYPYRSENPADGFAVNIQALLAHQQHHHHHHQQQAAQQAALEPAAAASATSYAACVAGQCGHSAQQSAHAGPHAAAAPAGGWAEGMRTLALSAALAAQVQAALQGLSSSTSLLHAGTAAAAGALCGQAAGADTAVAADTAQVLPPGVVDLDAATAAGMGRPEVGLPQAVGAPLASSPAASSCDSQFSPRSGRSMARLRRWRQQEAGTSGTSRAASGNPAGRCGGGVRETPGCSPALRTKRGGAEVGRDEEDTWGWLSNDDEQPRLPLATAKASGANDLPPRLRPAAGVTSTSMPGCGTAGAAAPPGRLKRVVGLAAAAKTLGLKAQAKPSPANEAHAVAKAAAAGPPIAASLRSRRAAEPQGSGAQHLEPSPARPAARRAPGTSTTASRRRPSSATLTPDVSPFAGGSSNGRSKVAVGKGESPSKRRL